MCGSLGEGDASHIGFCALVGTSWHGVGDAIQTSKVHSTVVHVYILLLKHGMCWSLRAVRTALYPSIE